MHIYQLNVMSVVRQGSKLANTTIEPEAFSTNYSTMFSIQLAIAFLDTLKHLKKTTTKASKQ